MKEPEFEKGYRQARRAAFGQSITKLYQMAGAAVSTLGKVRVDPNTSPSTKERAAEAILTHGAKAIELEDIEARVVELERGAETAKYHSQSLGTGGGGGNSRAASASATADPPLT